MKIDQCLSYRSHKSSLSLDSTRTARAEHDEGAVQHVTVGRYYLGNATYSPWSGWYGRVAPRTNCP